MVRIPFRVRKHARENFVSSEKKDDAPVSSLQAVSGFSFTPVADAPKPAVAIAKPHDHEHGFACACGHDHGEEGHSHSGVGLNYQLTILLPMTIAMLVVAEVMNFAGEDGPVMSGLGLLATIIAGGPIIWSAVKGLAKGRTNVNELVAMSIIGAISLGWFVEAGLVALILQIGALIEGVATESAQKAVLALQKLAPKHARVKHGDHDHVIEVEKLKAGDILVVMPGESIAADGEIVSGSSSINQASVTGESVPVDKKSGDEVLSGTINLTGSIEVKVSRVGEHSALGRMIQLVRRAQQFQPQIIRAADKFFAFYTPIILLLSAIVLWVTHDPVRMVTMWVVGCPCAMLLASPLAIVVSLARASRSGIQVKAGPFVEASATIQTVVFDKTGTLTTGEFIVSGVRPVEGVSANELLKLVATIEQRSSHPLARSIMAHALKHGILPSQAADVQVLDGLGVSAVVDGKSAVAGSMKIVPEEYAAVAARIDMADTELPVVPVYVMFDGKFMGGVYLTDEIRPEAARTIKSLRSLGVNRVVMLTGDRQRTAELVARQVGCNDVFAELKPEDKVNIVRNLQRGGKGVLMVGDGINDGAALAAATMSVAMGVRGTDVAVEAAHAVLMKDDLRKVSLLLYLAKQTRRAIYQNLMLTLGLAGFAEAAAALGWLSPVIAAIVHVLGVVIIALNSVRLAGDTSRAAPRLPQRPAPSNKSAPAAKDSGSLRPA
jgi:Cd2+/Zn2+-exporting ATPase